MNEKDAELDEALSQYHQYCYSTAKKNRIKIENMQQAFTDVGANKIGCVGENDATIHDTTFMVPKGSTIGPEYKYVKFVLWDNGTKRTKKLQKGAVTALVCLAADGHIEVDPNKPLTNKKGEIVGYRIKFSSSGLSIYMSK